MSALSCGDGVKLTGMWEVMFVPHPAAVPLHSHCPGRIFPVAQATAATAPTTPGLCSQTSIHNLHPSHFQGFQLPIAMRSQGQILPFSPGG